MEFRLRELFSLSPLIMACLIALLLATVEFGIYMGLPLWILPLLYIFWITPNYLLEIVEHRALGHPGWPVFSLETLVAGRSQAGILFFLLLLIAAAAWFALRYAGMAALAYTLLAAGLLVLPAAAALLAVTRDFRAALNPARWLAAAVGMGFGYLGCLSGMAAVLALSRYVYELKALYLYPLPVYALVLLAWLIGSVAWARRNALGIRSARAPEARAERARAEIIAIRNGILSQAYGFATRGNRIGALRHIEAYVASDENTPEARLWMLSEMLRWQDSAVPLEYGRRVIEYCEQHGLSAEANRARLQCEHLGGRDEAAP